MKLQNLECNKILYTNNIFHWIEKFLKQDNTIIITPITKIEELLPIKSNSILYREIQNNKLETMFNYQIIQESCDRINKLFFTEVLNWDVNLEKAIKFFYEVNNNIKINEVFLNKYFHFLNKNTAKQLNIIVVGFEDIAPEHFSMLNIHLLTSKLQNKVTWNNLESLIILDKQDGWEILDKEKFKSWIELKTKNVLNIHDFEDYFSGVATMQTFLINQALSNIE